MKQLLILSGKGGTGKTTIASAFIKLSNAKAYADCDVDAPNLHLTVKQKGRYETKDFYGLPKAEINQNKCIECGLCKDKCHFDAINYDNGYTIDYYACEGCGVCAYVCPTDAIVLNPAKTGETYLYKGENIFSTAKLKMGSGNSGKLVSEVKKNMTEAAADKDFAVIDGSPGIGCPVIASISGVDMVLIVAEPSVSGISDMERIITTAASFDVRISVCINKYDTNPILSEKIEKFCRQNGLLFIGKVPFDKTAIKAINQNKAITDFDCASGNAVKEIYNRTKQYLEA